MKCWITYNHMMLQLETFIISWSMLKPLGNSTPSCQLHHVLCGPAAGCCIHQLHLGIHRAAEHWNTDVTDEKILGRFKDFHGNELMFHELSWLFMIFLDVCYGLINFFDFDQQESRSCQTSEFHFQHARLHHVWPAKKEFHQLKWSQMRVAQNTLVNSSNKHGNEIMLMLSHEIVTCSCAHYSTVASSADLLQVCLPICWNNTMTIVGHFMLSHSCSVSSYFNNTNDLTHNVENSQPPSEFDLS